MSLEGAGGGPKIYALESFSASDGGVAEYKPDGTEIGQIDGLPYAGGIAVASDGDIYVANGPLETLLVFKPGATSPYQTLIDSPNFPEQVTLDRSGNVYVVNACSFPSGSQECTGPASVVRYAPGSTHVSSTYDTSRIPAPRYLAKGSAGLYVDGFANPSGAGNPEIGVFSGTKTFRTLKIPLTGAFPLAVDAQGRLAVAAGGPPNNSVIDVYELPSLQPAGTVSLDSPFLNAFALSGYQSTVWTADYESSVSGSVQRYGYPKARTAKTTIPVANGFPFGIAVYPPVVN